MFDKNIWGEIAGDGYFHFNELQIEYTAFNRYLFIINSRTAIKAHIYNSKQYLVPITY